MSDHLTDRNTLTQDSAEVTASASRRDFLGAGAALATVAFAQSDAQAGGQPTNNDNPGPENRPLTQLSPSSFAPPPTDHGEVQSFWNSFSTAHRRIQDGGWTREVNVETFPMAKEQAGVNMRLTAGGIRELHWHAAAEWAIMLTGNARLTAIDFEGRGYVQDVAAGDLWYFPTGIPHSIQGLQPDGCEFLLVFDDGKFSEGNTTLVTDWAVHTPRSVLAKNWGVQDGKLKPIAALPKEGKYIFQARVPGPLEKDRQTAAGERGPSLVAFDFHMMRMKPTKRSGGGEVRVVDSRNFPVAEQIAAAHVILRPGGLRELHWHPNADEWQYYIQGKGCMTLFVNGGKARTADFNAGDVGYVPRTLGHYIENTGTTDLVFLETFRSSRYQDLSLNDWLRHTPPELVLQHLGIDRETLETIPAANLAVLPR